MLEFAGVWWTPVFPLGMYSAVTDAMAAEIGQRALSTVSPVSFWGDVADHGHRRPVSIAARTGG